MCTVITSIIISPFTARGDNPGRVENVFLTKWLVSSDSLGSEFNKGASGLGFISFEGSITNPIFLPAPSGVGLNERKVIKYIIV